MCKKLLFGLWSNVIYTRACIYSILGWFVWISQKATVISMLTLCWWLNDGDSFKIVVTTYCFWDYFGMLVSTMMLRIGHQHYELVIKIRRQHGCIRPIKITKLNTQLYSHNELEYILEWLSKFTCQNFIRKFHFYISAHPNISTVITYNSELDLKMNFGPVLEYFDPWKPRDYRKIGIRSKFWPWLVSFMLATEPAMDNTLNCFNNYRSNLLSTQKLYTFDAKPNPDREIWKKIFHKFWIGVGIGSALGSSRVLFEGFRLLDVQKWHLLSSDSIINTKTEGLYNIIVTP